MTKTAGINKLVASLAIAGALSLTSLLGGAAHAATPSVSEVVVTKVADSTGPTLAGDVDHDGDVDGRDFLIWQRGSSPAPSTQPISHGDLGNWQTNYGSGY